MPWNSINNPFSKKFWDAASEELNYKSPNWKRGGAEFMKLVTFDVNHWKHEFNGDLDAAYADLDNYTAAEFGWDMLFLVGSFVGGAAIAKGVGFAAKTAGGKAFSSAISKAARASGKTVAQGNKAFMASVGRAKTMLKLFSSKKLVGAEAREYTKEVLSMFRSISKDGYVPIGGEKLPLDPELEGLLEAMEGSFVSGSEIGEAEGLDLATATLSRLETDIEANIATEEASLLTQSTRSAEEAAAAAEGYEVPTIHDFKEASKTAKYPYGRNPTREEFESWKLAEIEIRKLNMSIKGEFAELDPQLKSAADSTFAMFENTEMEITEDALKTAQFDVLVGEYHEGVDVFDDIIKKLVERKALRAEELAAREAQAAANWTQTTSRGEYVSLIDKAYGTNHAARLAYEASMKKLMRDLIILGVPPLAVGRLLFAYKPKIMELTGTGKPSTGSKPKDKPEEKPEEKHVSEPTKTTPQTVTEQHVSEVSAPTKTTPDSSTPDTTTQELTRWDKAIRTAIEGGIIPGPIEAYVSALDAAKITTSTAKHTDEIVLTEIAKVIGKGAGATVAAGQTGVMVPGSATSSAVGAGLSSLDQMGVPMADTLNAIWSFKSTLSGSAQAGEMVAGTANEAEMLSVLMGLGIGAGAATAGGAVAAGIVHAAYNEIQTPIVHDKVHQLVDQAVIDAARSHHGSTSVTIPTNDEDVTALSRNMLMELAQYATDVYLPTQGYSVIAEFTDEAGDFYARIYDAGDHDVLSIRGSSTRGDWVSNFDARKTPLSSVFTNEGFDVRGVDLNVHNGLATGLKSQFSQISNFITQRNNPFRVTGHSRGGGLATLFSYVYGVSSPDTIQPFETITFASPRVFASGSTKQYNSVVENAFRVYNDQDKVPMMPPQAMGFEHVGVGIELFANKFMIYVDEKGDFRFARENYAMVDHSPYNGTNIAYQQTALLLNKNDATYEYVRQIVLNEIPQGATALQTEIENATRPPDTAFMRTVNNVLQLEPNKPISIYMLGLPDGQYMHSMNVYLSRIQKLPAFLYGIPFTPEEEMEEVPDDDGFDDAHDSIGPPVHIPDFSINTPGTQCVCKPKTKYINGRHLISSEAECDCPESGKMDLHDKIAKTANGSPKSVANNQIQILGYVLYPEHQAPDYLNHYVAFV